MSRLSELVSKAAREMGSVAPNSSNRPLARAHLTKLDSNENPFGPSPRAIEAMGAALASAHTYPDDDCGELRRRLAAQHDVRAEQILVTPGSTGMLSLLCQTLLTPGLNAVTSACSFIVYPMVVRATGAQLIETPLRNDGFDLTAILKAIDSDTRLVFLANPNNPTGTMLPPAQIEEFLAAVPRHVVVVLDEAYYEFASDFAARRKAEYSQSLECGWRDANVVALRTFSKAHGLAGLRIGYGVGPTELMGFCAGMANTYSVSSVAQAAALAALDDQTHIERTVSNNTEQASVLEKGLGRLGFRVVPTWANFVYCDVGEDASGFAARLQAEGVIVRPLGAWGAPNCLRMTIGTAEQNQILLQAAKVARERKGSTETGG